MHVLPGPPHSPTCTVVPTSTCFVLQINQKYKEINILVNNAGVSFMKKTFTEDGVGGIAQV